MASPSHSSGSIQSLSAGNVVSAGFKLYGANFRQYLTIALFGTLWILLPFVAIFAVALFFMTVRGNYAALGLIIPALIVLVLYAIAKYQMNLALISRLAFGELTNQPEALADARRFVRSRQWSFLGAWFLLGLIYVGVVIVSYLVLAIVVVGLVAALGSFQLLQTRSSAGMANSGALALLGLLVILLFLAFLTFLLWLAARFVATEVPLAVEPGSTATRTIGRIWSLTKGSAWRIALSLFVASLITLPIQLLVRLMIGATNAIIGITGFSPGSSSYITLSLLIAYILSFAVSIVVVPLWQVIKAITYYDLRSRREGLGLQLHDRDLHDRDSQTNYAMRFFNRVSLSTPESVELEFTLAGIGNRTLALVIDYSVLAALLVGFLVLWSIFSLGLMSYLNRVGVNYVSAPIWLVAILLLLSFFLFTGYFAFFEVLWQGQTPGKRITKTRVIRDDGRPVGLSQAALRSLLRPIDDLFFFIGVLFILLGKQEKRLGDWAAGTLVIQEQRGDRKATLTISEPARKLAIELPQMADLSQLLPDDFAVVRAYLQRRRTMEKQAKNDLSMNLARQLRTVIALETIPANTTSDQFLEAIYEAYQQMVGIGDRGIEQGL